MKALKVSLAALLWMAAVGAQGEVKLPKVLADHMVLQRGVPIHLWGLAGAGEHVTVTLEADSVSGVADSVGRWSVTLPARPAGGPYKITVQGTNTVELNDVLVGDLWVASGQSNMEMPVKGFSSVMVIKDSATEIAKAQYPQIRLLHVKQAASGYPLDDLKDAVAWQLCSPETVGTFSAVGYFFGRNIYEQEKVPIGLIDSTWGGTPAEAWASMDGLSRSPAIGAVMRERAADMDGEEKILLQKGIDAADAAAGKTVPNRSSNPLIHWEPAALYNAMIAPLTKLPIRGVIWYQGESNASQQRAPDYGEVFGTLIEDWRTKWKIGDLPFLYVQIASYTAGPGWPIVRDQQRRTLRLKNTGMAVAIDVGEEHQIHPAQKQVVGERLALLAESIAYGKNVVSSGPLFKEAIPVDGGLKVTFDSGVGLKAVGGPLGGFEVAGEDGVFAAADATVSGDTVVVKSATVTKPVYVRYAWAGWPKVANLYNGADLPASPFTSQP